jgi:hypothetical protein
MVAIFCSLEVYHTIETGEGCAIALIAMRVEFFLRQDVPAALDHCQTDSIAIRSCWCFTARRSSYLAGKRYHFENFV